MFFSVMLVNKVLLFVGLTPGLNLFDLFVFYSFRMLRICMFMRQKMNSNPSLTRNWCGGKAISYLVNGPEVLIMMEFIMKKALFQFPR